MSKYNCRKCPIRSRCISESNNSPGAKRMLRHAFEARTDTLTTWNTLQRNCLLVKAEQDRSQSALTKRLHRMRQAQKEGVQSKKAVLPRSHPLSTLKPLVEQKVHILPDEPARQTPDYLQPVSSSWTKNPIKLLKRFFFTQQDTSGDTTGLCWLTVGGTGRHIALPVTGPLSLGRFDPNVGIPPDIDLTYEDQGAHLISRRHAAIVGQDGKHTIEDLGSKMGVFLNGTQVVDGSSPLLKPGDRIKLGNVRLRYERIPSDVLNEAKTEQVRHILLVTPTGRKLIITPPGKLIIGRADPHVNFVPDVDLSRDGEVAQLVSRRQACIQWKDGQPYLEDLGSSFGTRLGGEILPLGETVPLKPGDHIWLAGCVLAYDIEM